MNRRSCQIIYNVLSRTVLCMQNELVLLQLNLEHLESDGKAQIKVFWVEDVVTNLL